jgi:hypothetical protein
VNYRDTSALLKLLVNEPGSGDARAVSAPSRTWHGGSVPRGPEPPRWPPARRYFGPKTSMATRPALTAHGQPA